jgi:UDP-galactose transporter B1
MLYGICLVLLNLSLDGYTSNEQDDIFAKYSASSVEMMKYTNFWQSVYLSGFLVLCRLVFGSDSEASKAWNVFVLCPRVRIDILFFCLCAAVGQILILCVIKEFGSLVWVTVSVTRQLFTILLSVFLFSHPVNRMQWVGVALVFGGLSLEIVFNYRAKGQEQTRSASSIGGKEPKEDGKGAVATNGLSLFRRPGSLSLSHTPRKDRSLLRSLSSVERGIDGDDSPVSRQEKGKKLE